MWGKKGFLGKFRRHKKNDRPTKSDTIQPKKNEFIHFYDYVIAGQFDGSLAKSLLKKYNGVRLEELYNVKRVKNTKGICNVIISEYKTNIYLNKRHKVRRRVLSNLKLVSGIGDVTEGCLRRQGYKTLNDLLNHPKYYNTASQVITEVAKDNLEGLLDILCRKLPKSDPLVFLCSSLYDIENILAIDIETMGLVGMPIVLIGTGKVYDNRIIVEQYLLKDFKNEAALLKAALSNVSSDTVFLSYNGRSFDLPYIKRRLENHNLKYSLERPHFDLLLFVRKAWKNKLYDCRLDTVETCLLDIEREIDIPSFLIPQFYDLSLQTQNIGFIVPIIEHNRQDIVSLFEILSLLHKEWQA